MMGLKLKTKQSYIFIGSVIVLILILSVVGFMSLIRDYERQMKVTPEFAMRSVNNYSAYDAWVDSIRKYTGPLGWRFNMTEEEARREVVAVGCCASAINGVQPVSHEVKLICSVIIAYHHDGLVNKFPFPQNIREDIAWIVDSAARHNAWDAGNQLGHVVVILDKMNPSGSTLEHLSAIDGAVYNAHITDYFEFLVYFMVNKEFHTTGNSLHVLNVMNKCAKRFLLYQERGY